MAQDGNQMLELNLQTSCSESCTKTAPEAQLIRLLLCISWIMTVISFRSFPLTEKLLINLNQSSFI